LLANKSSFPLHKIGMWDFVSLQVLISFPIKIEEILEQRKMVFGAIFFKFPLISKENFLVVKFFVFSYRMGNILLCIWG
jgi:hypothetical protein